MTSELILKSFQATGVWPMDADAVLKRFNNHPPRQDNDAEIGEHGDGDSWPELRKIFDAAVADKARVEAKRLDSVLLRSGARRRKHKLKRWLPNERSKSSNATLQPFENLTIYSKSVSKKPHTVLQKMRQSVVVLWLREVGLTLFLQLRLPHPNLLRAAATLRNQLNINSIIEAQGSI